MTEFAYLIALVPLFSFIMIVFFLRWKEKLASGWSIASILASWVMSLIVLIETIGRHGEPYEMFFYLTAFKGINFEIGILIDGLTAVMLMVVTTVASCVPIAVWNSARFSARSRSMPATSRPRMPWGRSSRVFRQRRVALMPAST